MNQTSTSSQPSLTASAATSTLPHPALAYCAEQLEDLARLLARYGMVVEHCPDHTEIPGSYWGDSEAGLIANTLFVRGDTPVHSALHEACHYICMDQDRRSQLHTDAGGDVLEECAVNYLQILLADQLSAMGRERMMQDMDRWGYSFRLGSTQAWFQHDAADARTWLVQHQLMDEQERVLFRCRQ